MLAYSKEKIKPVPCLEECIGKSVFKEKRE